MRTHRRLLTLLFCGALVLARLLGLHLHLTHGLSPSPVESAAPDVTFHHEHQLAVATDLDADHDLGAWDSGSVDVSVHHNPVAKLPSLNLAALVAAAFALLLLLSFPRGVTLPALSLPALPRPPYFQPPSHAPPQPH